MSCATKRTSSPSYKLIAPTRPAPTRRRDDEPSKPRPATRPSLPRTSTSRPAASTTTGTTGGGRDIAARGHGVSRVVDVRVDRLRWSRSRRGATSRQALLTASRATASNSSTDAGLRRIHVPADDKHDEARQASSDATTPLRPSAPSRRQASRALIVCRLRVLVVGQAVASRRDREQCNRRSRGAARRQVVLTTGCASMRRTTLLPGLALTRRSSWRQASTSRLERTSVTTASSSPSHQGARSPHLDGLPTSYCWSSSRTSSRESLVSVYSSVSSRDLSPSLDRQSRNATDDYTAAVLPRSRRPSRRRARRGASSRIRRHHASSSSRKVAARTIIGPVHRALAQLSSPATSPCKMSAAGWSIAASFGASLLLRGATSVHDVSATVVDAG